MNSFRLELEMSENKDFTQRDESSYFQRKSPIELEANLNQFIPNHYDVGEGITTEQNQHD
jgi:hypothetical protein